MTSGGLLVALDAARAAEVPGAVIGRLVAPTADASGHDPGRLTSITRRCRPRLSGRYRVVTRASGSPTNSPTSTPTPSGDPACLANGERHQRDDDPDHKRSEQVTLDLLARLEREQVRNRPRDEHRERGAVRALDDRERRDRRRGRDPADAAEQIQTDDRERTVAALEQPPVEGDRAQRDEREPGVAVGERRGDQPPPVRAGLADDGDVGEADEARPPEQAADETGEDEHQRRVRARLGPDPWDLARP